MVSLLLTELTEEEKALRKRLLEARRLNLEKAQDAPEQVAKREPRVLADVTQRPVEE